MKKIVKTKILKKANVVKFGFNASILIFVGMADKSIDYRDGFKFFYFKLYHYVFIYTCCWEIIIIKLVVYLKKNKSIRDGNV